MVSDRITVGGYVAEDGGTVLEVTVSDRSTAVEVTVSQEDEGDNRTSSATIEKVNS